MSAARLLFTFGEGGAGIAAHGGIYSRLKLGQDLQKKWLIVHCAGGGVEGYEKHGCSTVLHPRKQSSPVHNYNSFKKKKNNET